MPDNPASVAISNGSRSAITDAALWGQRIRSALVDQSSFVVPGADLPAFEACYGHTIALAFIAFRLAEENPSAFDALYKTAIDKTPGIFAINKEDD